MFIKSTMVNSYFKSDGPIAIFILCLCFQISLSFEFPDTIESETGKEIFISKLDDDQACVPLKDCPTLSWLKRELPSEKYIAQLLSPRSISKTLKSKRCVIRDADSEDDVTMETRVVCPKIHDKSVNKMEKDCDEDCDDEDDYEVRTVFELERRTSLDCSIELQHGELDDPLKDLQIKSLSSKRKKYGHLKRLRNRRVLRVSAHGFCCWRVYQKTRFRGESTFIEPDDEAFPEHLIKSTQAVECDE